MRRSQNCDGSDDEDPDAEPPLPPLHERPWGGVVETARYFGISRSLLYDLMGDGSVKFTKVHARRLVHIPSLLALLEQDEAAA
jgi:hypothetical protein